MKPSTPPTPAPAAAPVLIPGEAAALAEAAADVADVNVGASEDAGRSVDVGPEERVMVERDDAVASDGATTAIAVTSMVAVNLVELIVESSVDGEALKGFANSAVFRRHRLTLLNSNSQSSYTSSQHHLMVPLLHSFFPVWHAWPQPQQEASGGC